MSGILPAGKTPATRVNPRILLFYGMPKVGKTTEMAKLEGNLILDAERGTELIDAMRIPINSISGPTTMTETGEVAFTSISTVIAEVMQRGLDEFNNTGQKPKPPYKYITMDTIDKLEEMCEVTATAKYKDTAMGKSFAGNSVIELPNGAGYYHLRNEVLLQVGNLARICEHLILVSHVKDKVLNKGGVDVSSMDISLTGKLGQIVAAQCDVIGYMYREPKKPLMVSFETQENTTMGARVPRLAGLRVPFDWNTIFI